MTQEQVARKLGVSRTLVQAIELRALTKVAIALDLPPPPMPRWMDRFNLRRQTRGYRCGNCGENGHTRVTCGREPKVRGAR